MDAGDPTIRGFQFDSGVIGAIKSSINLYRGTVNLPLPLLDIPGRNGLDIQVSAIYRGATPEEATTRNQDSSTGPLGLGWDLPLDEIVVEYPGGQIDPASATYWLRTGGQTLRLLSDGPGGYVTGEQRFWKITYDSSTETWSVIREDGNTWTYGGKDGAGRCLEYGLRWDRWQGPSIAGGTQAFVTAWKLRSISTSWDDRVSFAYEFGDQTLTPGGASYTRECQLASIRDTSGYEVTFHYADKVNTAEVQEYQPEHARRAGYQDRYDTRYLISLSVDRYGERLFDTLFASTPRDFSGTREPGLFKRTLDSLTTRYPGRAPEPGLAFSYQPSGELAPGSLASIAYPHGGSATYQYGRVALEHAVVAAGIPREPGTPGLWFGSDYVVATFQRGASLSLVVYTWLGGWVESFRQTVAAAGDVEKLRVYCRQGFFTVHYASAKSENAANTAVYAQQRYRPDEWSCVFQTNADGLAAGDGTLALQTSGSPEVRVYQCLESRVLLMGSYTLPYTRIALAAGTNCFAVLSCDEDSGEAQVGLLSRDARNNWSYAEADVALRDVHWGYWLPDTFWSVGSGFAAATFRNQEQTRYTVAVLSWTRSSSDPRWQALGSYPIPDQGHLPFDSSAVAGSLVGNCQHLWRFDGERWKAQELGKVPVVTDPDEVAARFAYAEDVALMSVLKDGGTTHYRTSYDPTTGNWSTPARLAVSDPGEHGPAPATASRAFLTAGSDVFAQQGNGSWHRLGEGALGPSVNPDSVRNASPGFFVSEDSSASATSVVLLKNGQFAQQQGEPYVTLPGERCLVTGKDGERPGTFLLFGRTFATYTGSSFGQASSLKLYRILDAEFTPTAGRHTALVVKGLTVAGPGEAFTTYYDYNEALPQSNEAPLARGAAYSPGSRVAQFPRVGVHNGVAYGQQQNAVRPAGVRVHYFMNGVRPDADGVFYPYSDPSARLTNCRSYYGALNGTLLYEEEYDSTERLVGCGLHYWYVQTQETEAGTAWRAYPRRSLSLSEADWGYVPGSSTAAQIQALDNRTVPPALRAKLVDLGMELSGNVQVAPIQRGARWLIMDEGHDRGFVAVLNDDGTLGLRVGLRQTRETRFNPRNGLAAETLTSSVGLDGRRRLVSARTLYFCDVHPDLAAERNFLSHVVQTTAVSRPAGNSAWEQEEGEPEYLRSDVTLWWPWSSMAGGQGYVPQERFANPGSRIAPSAGFTWSGPSSQEPVFDAWTTGKPDPSRWQPASRTVARSSAGQVLEHVSADEVSTSYQYTSDESEAVAQFVNARVTQGEASWYGLEAYENNPGWSVEPGSGGPRVTTEDARTGKRCASLLPGETLGYRFAPQRPQRYLFSAWVRYAADPGSGHAATWEFPLAEGGGQAAPAISLSYHGGGWYYVSAVLDLRGTVPSKVPAVRVRLVNPLAGREILVDELRLCVFSGGSSARVLDGKRPVVSAAVDTNGHAVLQGTSRNDLTLASVSATGQVTLRSAFAQPPGKPAAPRSTALSVTLAEQARLTFFTARNWPEVCTAEQRSSWSVEEGSLRYSGSGPGALTFPAWGTGADVALQCELELPPMLTRPLRWQIGEAIELLLEPGGEFGVWKLVEAGGSAPAPVPNPRGGTVVCTLVSTGGYLFLFVEGVRIFGCRTSGTGRLRLVAAEAGTGLRNLATGGQPGVVLQYPTPTGGPGQTQVLDEGAAIIRAELADPLSRPAVSTKPARMAPDDPHDLLAYWEGFARMDWGTGRLVGKLADYYSPGGGGDTDDGGFPFVRNSFESRPDARIRELGRPGAGEAIRPDAAHTAHLSWSVNRHGQFGSALPLPAGLFRVLEMVTPDGVRKFQVQNQQDRTVAHVAPAADGSFQALVAEYDALGKIARWTGPNGQGPGNDTWSTTFRYDSHGNPVETTSPDGGRVVQIFSPGGRLRFSQDAEGRARQAAGRADAYYRYWTYDPLGRPLEVGVMAGNWNAPELEARAANVPQRSGQPDWPPAGTAGAGWSKRFTYDGDGSRPNVVGRLWKVESRSPTGNDEILSSEEYAYDAAGRIVSVIADVRRPGSPNPEPIEIAYGYDSESRVVRRSCPGYPDLRYSYDRQGRLTALGTSDNPREYAWYEYTPDGRLWNTHLGVSGGSVSFPRTYDASGRLLCLGDASSPYQEELFYQRRPNGQSGYFDEALSAVREQLRGLGSGPISGGWDYEIDAQGRLCKAVRIGQPAGELQWEYDPNGNLTRVRQSGISESSSGDDREYRYERNRVTEVRENGAAGGKFQYDANGSVTVAEGRAVRLEWDPVAGKPVLGTAEVPTPARVQLGYGAADARVLKLVTRGKERTACRYVYGSEERPLLEISHPDGGASRNRQLIPGPHGLLILDGTERYFAIPDHLSSTRMVLDGQGKAVAGFDYLPFGELLRTHGPRPEVTHHLYTGQEWDGELGLYNYQARMYDPALGRFYSQDPLREFASPYLYSGNNPAFYLDPTGMLSTAFWVELTLGIVVVIAGIVVGFMTGGAAAAPASAWAISIFGGMASGALMGAGGGAIGYAVAHPEEGYNSAVWTEVGIGALSGAIAGGIGRLGTQFATRTATNLFNATQAGGAGGGAMLIGGTIEGAVLRWAPRAYRMASSVFGGFTSGVAGSYAQGDTGSAPWAAGGWSALASLLQASMGEASHYITGKMATCCGAGRATSGYQVGRAIFGAGFGAMTGLATGALSNLSAGKPWDRNIGATIGVGAFIGILTNAPRYEPRGLRAADHVRTRSVATIAMLPLPPAAVAHEV